MSLRGTARVTVVRPPRHRGRTSLLPGTGRCSCRVTSRVIDRRMVFAAKHKEVFRKILRNHGAFSGVRPLTH